MAEVIYKGIFGSRLYGTFNENSDTDIRQIHKNSLEEIILKKGSNVFSEHSNPDSKNSSKDYDFESKELRRFVRDLLSGQTYAHNLLFSPESCWLAYSPIWLELQANKSKLVTKNIKPYLGYIKGQKDKYLKKGDKLKELINLKKLLSNYSGKTLLGKIYQPTDRLDFEHIKLGKSFNSSSKKDEDMLIVVDSKYPLNRTLKEVLKSIDGKIEAFGERSRKAAENAGWDEKAMYHAFRVVWEFETLLQTGELKFPSRFRELMKKIRNGDYKKEFLEYWLLSEIARVEKIENHLPEPDYEYWDNWILEKYLK